MYFYSTAICLALCQLTPPSLLFGFLPGSIVGYCAHWRESLADPDTKIIRPQQDYRGVWLRHYADLPARAAEGERHGG